MTAKRMLLSFAHPDDETFGMGGVIAKYAHEGVEISLICSTQGDRGTIPPEFLERHGSVSAVRYAELECAAQKLGIQQLFRLGYSDSGMMGTPDNDHPDCLWQANEEEVVSKIVAVIRQVKPQIVVTFDAFGGYGHPDHIFMYRTTTKAFFAAGDAAQYPDAGPAYAPQKLYYMPAKKLLIGLGVIRSLIQRQNPRKIGANRDIDLIAILQNVPPTHTTIQVGKFLEIWDEANRCHASQWQQPPMRKWLRQLIYSGQSFVRVAPKTSRWGRRETDFFAEVQI
ncbi:MAG: PIG-L family deacetylase [Chloroflexi bacterium]|nr:PIG-L family deacetylase [Chloroflexota bacterium]